MIICLDKYETPESARELFKRVANDDFLWLKLKEELFKETNFAPDDLSFLIDVYVR